MKSKLIYAFILFSFLSKFAFANQDCNSKREKVETFVGMLEMVQIAEHPEVVLVVSENEIYRLQIFYHLRGVTLNNIGKRVEVKGVRVQDEKNHLYPLLKVKNLVHRAR
jgi:hypothetical protein